MLITMSELVYIVILNWNKWNDTIECLESLLLLTYPNYRIVIIDNNSTDDSVSCIKSWAQGDIPVRTDFIKNAVSNKDLKFIEYDGVEAENGGLLNKENNLNLLAPHIVLIQTGANLGYAGGNNIGIRYALKKQADYIWILNNDAIVDRNSLAEMISVAERDERLGMVGSKLLYYDKPDKIQSAGGGRFNFWQGLSHQYGWLEEDHGQWDKIFEPYYINGASLLVKSAVIRTAGLMNESFFLYGEELEWQIRVKQHGWSLLYCPSAKVWHKENSTLGYKSPIIEFYYTRSCLWIIREYSFWTLPTTFIFHSLRILRRLIRGDFRRALAVLKGLYSGLFDKLPDFRSTNV
jgi:GT2 family glycosyltransferase